jgi:hypothetical protein
MTRKVAMTKKSTLSLPPAGRCARPRAEARAQTLTGKREQMITHDETHFQIRNSEVQARRTESGRASRATAAQRSHAALQNI